MSELANLVAATQPILGWLWDVLNSNFSAALLGAGLGAIAGAWAAQRLGRNDERRRRLVDELISTNRAIMLTFGVTNAFLGLKKQHIAALQEEYAVAALRLEAIEAINDAGGMNHSVMVTVPANLNSLQSPATQIDALAQVILERVVFGNRPIAFLNHLVSSVEGLRGSAAARNTLVAEIKGRPQEELIRLYFGLRDEHGHIDTRFENNVEALASQTDDCIYFSMGLAKLLDHHARRVALTLNRPLDNIPTADFSSAKEYLPDPTNYEDHEAALQEWLSEPVAPLKN